MSTPFISRLQIPMGPSTGSGRSGAASQKPSAATPDFPADVMAGAAGEFADIYSSCVEVPRQFFFMSYLTCLGNILADKITLTSFISHQPRLYTLLLGKSGDDRKSTAISKTVEFFERAHADLKVCRGVGSAEGLQKTLERGRKLVLFLDEFKQFIGKCKIDSSVLLPCVNTLFESNSYESQTSQKEIILKDVYLSLLAASTVATYENTWSKHFTDIGFNNRLWLVSGSADHKFAIPPRPPEGAEEKLQKELQNVIRFAGEHRELDLTPDARKLYVSWYENRGRGVHSTRIDTYAARLMPLLAMNSQKPVVDEQVVWSVIAMCDHQLEVRKALDPIDADNQLAALEQKTQRVLARGPLGKSELKRAVNYARVGLGPYTQALRNLTENGHVRFDKAAQKYSLIKQEGAD
jgi:hypothetical protein